MPIPSRETLEASRSMLWDSALEASSAAAYRRALRQWLAFALSLRSPEIPTIDSLSLFVVWRLGTVLPSTVRGDLSALAWEFKPRMGEKEWTRVRQSAEVLRAMRGGSKVRPHSPRQAPPLLKPEVDRAIAAGLAPNPTYDTLLFATQVVFLFFACGRAAEVTDADNRAYRTSKKRMLRSRLSFTSAGIKVFLPYQKASPLYAGSYYHFALIDVGMDAARLVARYLEARDALHGRGGPLWLKADGSVPLRRWFVTRLRRLAGKQFTGHSLRPGGATWYILRGADDRTVRHLGRWSSAAWEQYIRLQPELLMAIRVRDATRQDPSLRNLATSDDLNDLLRQHGLPVKT